MSIQSKINIKPYFHKILIFLYAFTIVPSVSAQVWETATSKHRTDDRIIIFRYLKEFKNGFDPGLYPDHVTLTWTYSGNKGMPSPDERIKMDKLEDALQPLLDKDSLAVLTMASTGNNVREWTYYAKSTDSFKRMLDMVLKELTAPTVKFHTSSDSEWAVYKNFKATVKE